MADSLPLLTVTRSIDLLGARRIRVAVPLVTNDPAFSSFSYHETI